MDRESFWRDGYILVPDVFTPAEMADALDACDRTFYGGRRFDPERAEGIRDGFFTDDAAGRSQFPVGSPALDRLIENERYLDLFAACLGTDAMAYCNAHLFLRSGPTDTRHPAHPWEGYHFDHDTNSFLPPNAAFDPYAYVNSWVFLHDVEIDGAPLHVIPGSHRQIFDLLPRLLDEGLFKPPTTFTDIRRVPEFAEPVPVVAKAGSALLYSSYLVHAAVPFVNKRAQRAVWTLSLGRKEADAYVRFANAYAYGERNFAVPFWKSTTPRVRSLFGWPPTGDPYYTDQTLALLARWYPEMDLSGYR